MGYTIMVGNGVFAPDDDATHLDDSCIQIEPAELDEAPRLDRVNPGRNTSWPSYSAVSERAGVLGLHDLFLGPEGLLRPHPGVVRLTQEHADVLSTALHDLRAQHDDIEPRFLTDEELYNPGPNGEPPGILYGRREYDWATSRKHSLMVALAWLIWFEFWVGWAVENCKLPAIKNS